MCLEHRPQQAKSIPDGLFQCMHVLGQVVGFKSLPAQNERFRDQQKTSTSIPHINDEKQCFLGGWTVALTSAACTSARWTSFLLATPCGSAQSPPRDTARAPPLQRLRSCSARVPWLLFPT